MSLRCVRVTLALVLFLFYTIGYGNGQTNVAIGSTVTLSSQYQNPKSVPASPGSKAVDGNTSTDWYAGGCACTKKESFPSMLVDLGSIYTVDHVRIFNRYDASKNGCCPNRLRDFTVSVGIDQNALSEVYTHSGTFPVVGNVSFEAQDVKFVKIVIRTTEYLTICELEIYEIGDPVDGGWTEWGELSPCTKTCGDGTRTMSRSCTNPAPRNGGADCEGDSTETVVCSNEEECPVNGGWTAFSDWTQCSVTCGHGYQTRDRSCSNPAPSGGGSVCSGTETEAKICAADPCPDTQTAGCNPNFPPAHCEDVRLSLLQNGQHASSGEYVIQTMSGYTIPVYCDFYNEDGISYTFLSRSAIEVIDTTTLKSLYNNNHRISGRLLYSGDKQEDLVVEQLSSFQGKYPLSVQVNEFIGYPAPYSKDASRYLYLGFQPNEAGNTTAPEKSNNPKFGLRTNGKDYRFWNCDMDAKSYVAFYTDEEGFTSSENYYWFNDMFPESEWNIDSQLVPNTRLLPTSYFMPYEVCFGGCGGYATSLHGLEIGIVGATIGLATDYKSGCPKEPEPVVMPPAD